jgi:hypothetical protein
MWRLEKRDFHEKESGDENEMKRMEVERREEKGCGNGVNIKVDLRPCGRTPHCGLNLILNK